MPIIDTFTTSGTWTCPANVISIAVECHGGGGGGGGGNASFAGGGGAGGNCVISNLTSVPGTVYTVNVGTGGIGGISVVRVATAGGDSWFNTSATVIAKGGGAGGNGETAAGTAGVAVAGNIGNLINFLGGNGAAAVGTTFGAGGSGAGNTGNSGPTNQGIAAVGITPGAAVNYLGGAGGGNGAAGSVYGGGGGGGNNIAGGAGANGLVRVIYTVGNITKTFTTSSTWTCPADVTSIDVQCTGGGGGGCGALNFGSSAGGGGGAYSQATVSVTPGVTYSCTVGAGGAGGISNTTDAGSGGDTYFNTTGTVLAKGGQGSLVNTATRLGGQASAGVGTLKYSGGNFTFAGGVPTNQSGAGGGAGALGNGINGLVGSTVNTFYLGPGASLTGGAGGSNANSVNPGGMYGGGGGGNRGRNGGGAVNGGPGGVGLLILTYTSFVVPVNSTFFDFFD